MDCGLDGLFSFVCWPSCDKCLYAVASKSYRNSTVSFTGSFVYNCATIFPEIRPKELSILRVNGYLDRDSERNPASAKQVFKLRYYSCK
jgi:hypothetical protein